VFFRPAGPCLRRDRLRPASRDSAKKGLDSGFYLPLADQPGMTDVCSQFPRRLKYLEHIVLTAAGGINKKSPYDFL